MKLRFGIIFALLAVLVVGANVGGVERAETAAQLGQDFPSFTPAPYNYQPLGFAQVAVTSTAQTFGAAGVTVPTGARLAVMTVDAANVRYRDDGAAPTASIGIQLSSSGAEPVETAERSRQARRCAGVARQNGQGAEAPEPITGRGRAVDHAKAGRGGGCEDVRGSAGA
jgi:hypothetical protein